MPQAQVVLYNGIDFTPQARAGGLRADPEVARGAAGGRIKEEVRNVLSQSILVWQVAPARTTSSQLVGAPLGRLDPNTP